MIELAEHPNLIGIKESSGDVEKVRKLVEGTRHIKRSATVTETFDPVTPRMIAAAASGSNGGSGVLVQVGAMMESADGSPRLASPQDRGRAESSEKTNTL